MIGFRDEQGGTGALGSPHLGLMMGAFRGLLDPLSNEEWPSRVSV